eukprot:289590_1
MQSTSASLFSAGLSQLAQSLNFNPPAIPHNGKLLASYHKELNEVYIDIKSIYHAFKSFCKSTCKATDMSIDISRSIHHFYDTFHDEDDADDDSKEEMHPEYTACTGNIASEAVKTFCMDDQFGNVILKALQQWLVSIKSLKNEIDHAQTLYNEMCDYNEQLQVLLVQQREEQHEHEEAINNDNILSSINDMLQHKNLEKISNQINEILLALDPLADTFNKLKTRITLQYNAIMDNRYTKFDSIYCQILESQKYFYDYCHEQITLTKQSQQMQGTQPKEVVEEKQQIQFENMIDLDGHETNTQRT